MKDLCQTDDSYFLLDTGCHIYVSNDTVGDTLLLTCFLKTAHFPSDVLFSWPLRDRVTKYVFEKMDN